jgi:hypothetical protein
VSCPADVIHSPVSERHTLECVVYAPPRGIRNGAQSMTPGSWNAGDAGGRARYGRNRMERSRSSFENFDLHESIKPASGMTEETIHDGEKAEKGEMLQLLLLEGRG